MDKNSKIYVAGHTGLVGSAILRQLRATGYARLLTVGQDQVDLTVQAAVDQLFEREKPEYVFLAAARVGGILANDTYPGSFIRDNLLIQTHVMDAANRTGVTKLLLLGSACIYPRLAPQPISEDDLLSGPLEPTNAPYAVAKIAGIMMAQAYRKQYGLNAICLMPTNLYGPGDNFDPRDSHVAPALLRKVHEAKMSNAPHVVVWGTGEARREFLYVDDMADAAIFMMRNYNSGKIVNIGVGQDVSVTELVKLMMEVVGYPCGIVFDRSKPDGTPRRQLDSSYLNSLGWSPKIDLREGLTRTYEWYVKSLEHDG